MITYFGTIENGLLKIKGRKQFDFELKQFEGKEVEISIKRKKKKRSNNQNSLYWAWCSILAADTGFTKEQMHDVIKFKFLAKKVYYIGNTICELQGDFYVDKKSGELVEGTAKEIEMILSTTELSISEFAAFMNDLEVWAKEFFNITLPHQNEQLSF